MARTYSNTTDQHRFPLITQMTGTFSIGAWVNRATNTTFDTFYSRCTSANAAKVAVQINTSGKIALELSGVGEKESTTTVKSEDGWTFIGIDKATGSTTPRCHIWKQASGWTHQNLSGAIGNPVTASTSATVRIGEWQGGSTDNFNGDIETVVEYNGIQLTDGQWESVAFSRWGILAKKPTGLWELRQSEVKEKVPDISGTGMNESVREGTSVSTRSCPFYYAGASPNYTKSGVGGPASYNANIAETLTTSDEIKRSAQVTRVPAETLTTSETDKRSVTTSRSQSETLTTLDTDTRATAANRKVAESISTSETPTRQTNDTRQPTETLSTADAVTRADTLSRSIADTTSTSDAIASKSGYSRAESDSLSTSDSPARSFATSRKVAETLSITDAITRTTTFLRTISESIPSSEIVTRLTVVKRSLAETTSISDVVSRETSAGGTFITETLSTSDLVKRSLAGSRAEAESLTTADSVKRGTSILRPVTESLSSADSVSRANSVKRKIIEALATEDSLVRSISIIRKVNDSLAISEAISRNTGFMRQALETLTTVDVAKRTTFINRNLVEVIPVTDSPKRAFSIFRTILEELSTEDHVTRVIILPLASYDGLLVLTFEDFTSLKSPVISNQIHYPRSIVEVTVLEENELLLQVTTHDLRLSFNDTGITTNMISQGHIAKGFYNDSVKPIPRSEDLHLDFEPNKDLALSRNDSSITIEAVKGTIAER